MNFHLKEIESLSQTIHKLDKRIKDTQEAGNNLLYCLSKPDADFTREQRDAVCQWKRALK